MSLLRRSIATSQLREAIAWALRNSKGASPLISDATTLMRYSSTETSLTATRVPCPEGRNIRSPEKVCSSLRSQWNRTPIVTS